MKEDLERTHIYQSFYFDQEIKSRYYPGNSFSRYDKEMGIPELLDLQHDIIEEGEFMPGLTRQIESLIGDGNFVSDFWEFGPDCFSLYWWIKKEVYKEKIILIKQWAEYEGISKWMEIPQK